MPAEENSPIEETVRGLIITSSVEDCIFSILYLVPTSVGVSIGMTDLNVCYQQYILCILTTEDVGLGGRASSGNEKSDDCIFDHIYNPVMI